MGQRIKIKENGVELLDLAKNEPFRLDGVHYPPGWFLRGGALPPKFTVEEYDPAPPAPAARWVVRYYLVLKRMEANRATQLDNFLNSLHASRREEVRAIGIWSDDTEIRDKLTQLGSDPNVILART